MVAPNAVSREQAYLTAVANQPKDIDPDRIYEVSTKPEDKLSKLFLPHSWLIGGYKSRSD
jgi:hypothetical protein